MQITSILRLVSAAFILTIPLDANAQSINHKEVAYQNANFQRWWDTTLIWRYSRLPEKGAIPTDRLPYAGHIYPDKSGGCANVLSKYDMAFHGGRQLATAWEFQDIKDHKQPAAGRGFFRRTRRLETPYWAGHCNGWTAAAIRHAEPRRSVRQNGVVFTPADIKGLMAELYVYSDIEFLGGEGGAINPGLLHVIVTNWIGRGEHPVGMDATVGEEVWNYPIYAFTSNAVRYGSRVEVKMNLGYVHYINNEVHRAPRNLQHRYFHYWLDLNADGEIVGGTYAADSQKVDMLWVPLKPTQGGKTGNELGNPHLNVDVVMNLWRKSVTKDQIADWWNIDPLPEDAIDASPEEFVTADPAPSVTTTPNVFDSTGPQPPAPVVSEVQPPVAREASRPSTAASRFGAALQMLEAAGAPDNTLIQ